MVSVIPDRVRFLLSRLRERLWVKPLVVCLMSIGAVFVTKLADATPWAHLAPEVAEDSIEKLLSIMATSMLVIATFSVGSMVSAYASASSTATPRSFAVVVADGASQNALSTFVGAFIFGIVALSAVQNEHFGPASLAVLFALTVVVFGAVIATFVRWVDRIARLGRLGTTTDKVEQATAASFGRRRASPHLGGVPAQGEPEGRAVYATSVGYVQHVDMAELQAWASRADARVHIAALPGTFATPDRPLAFVSGASVEQHDSDDCGVADFFQIGGDRRFEDDPRFGLIVLAEIAGRALSPAVNDPGTAIDIIGTLVRLFVSWNEPVDGEQEGAYQFDRVDVPALSVRDLFDDAFTTIGRDGAGMVEVQVRLQKALRALASLGDADMRAAATHHARLALKRAQGRLTLAEDLTLVEDAARFAEQPG